MTLAIERPKTAAAELPRTSARDVIAMAKKNDVRIVDLRFVDLPGTWQHFSIPVGELSEALFTDGIGFDGSSIRGFQHINESDMLLMADPTSAFVDPVLGVRTLDLIEEVLYALEADHDFLLRGDVFTEDLIETWIALKRDSAKQVALRPHPYEFYLYSDV